ncbi:MAG: NAD-dependent epimerase/dehydratase family protein [Pseudomonadota bacterium]
MHTVLVTGATGFTGSHVLQRLDGQPGLRAIAACRDSARLAVPFAGEIRSGDLRDAAYVNGLCRGVDTVCQCAAWTSLHGHRRDSRERFLEPVLRLIDAAHAAGVRRFINVSTTSAAAPDHSADADSAGIPRRYWPHLCNVVAIEERLRALAGTGFSVINLRIGLFAGNRYGLGLLPILLPRLRTHLVPWVAGGRTGMPIVDGRDIGQAFLRAVQAPASAAYRSYNIVGPTVPSVREVIGYLHAESGCPLPHFSVPFPAAFAFAWLLEMLDPLLPWDPLVTRSIVHLLRDTQADNDRARVELGYEPEYGWREAVRTQLGEMAQRQRRPMRMAVPPD